MSSSSRLVRRRWDTAWATSTELQRRDVAMGHRHRTMWEGAAVTSSRANSPGLRSQADVDERGDGPAPQGAEPDSSRSRRSAWRLISKPGGLQAWKRGSRTGGGQATSPLRRGLLSWSGSNVRLFPHACAVGTSRTTLRSWTELRRTAWEETPAREGERVVLNFP